MNCNKSSLSEKIGDAYNFAIHVNGDVRTADWPLVYGPWYPGITVVAYIAFCFYARRLTKNLPTYALKHTILAYNLAMLFLNIYMVYEFFYVAIMDEYDWGCEPVDYSYSPLAVRMASVCWVYYITKYAELLETIFFALRKKYSQITFLHCYHHVTMLTLWWCVTKWTPGGQSFLFGGCNSFVHFVMYTYYGMSAMGPSVRKYLWWKKYITILQLTQFVALFFYCIVNVLKKCDFPKYLCLSMVGYSVTLAILFLNFYVHAYASKPCPNPNTVTISKKSRAESMRSELGKSSTYCTKSKSD